MRETSLNKYFTWLALWTDTCLSLYELPKDELGELTCTGKWGNKEGHLSKTPLNLLEIHKISPVDTFESK